MTDSSINKHELDFPDKPDGDRDSVTFTSLGVTLETATDREKENLQLCGPDDGHMEPDAMKSMLERGGTSVAKSMWDNWAGFIFSHRYVPIPLFDTQTTTVDGIDARVAGKGTHGRDDSPVLRRSGAASDHILDAGKIVCLQYAITADKEPGEVCADVPYDLFPTEVWRAREFVDEHGVAWAIPADRPWWDRSPVGVGHEARGVIYVMYIRDSGHNTVIPKYIGLSRKYGIGNGELNWNFANITSDSVFGRWGYGKSQHLGELSCAIWPDEYRWDPAKKYKKWADDLFVDRTRVLRRSVYIEVLPWFSDDPVICEENMIMLASELFGDHLLNTEYTEQVESAYQTTL